MDLVTMGIGIVICLYGIYTMTMRKRSPEKFGKLKAMKEKHGDSTGLAIHIMAYTVVPIVVGIILSFAGFNGLSLLGMFKS
jgi:low temperature requirement protein LtrA